MRRRRRQCSTGERSPHRHCRRPPHRCLPLPQACLRPPPHSPRASCLQPPPIRAKAAAAALRRRQRGRDAAACVREMTRSLRGHSQQSRDQRRPAAPAALAPSPPCEQSRRAAAAGRRAAPASTPDQVRTRRGRQEVPQREPWKRPRRAGSGTPSPLRTCPSEKSGTAWARKGRLRRRDRRQRRAAWAAAQRVGDGVEPGRTQGGGSPLMHGLGGDRTLVCKNGQSTRVQCPRAKNAQGFAVPASDWRRASAL